MNNKDNESTNQTSGEKKETPRGRRKTVRPAITTGQRIPEQEGTGLRIQGFDISDQSISDRRARNKHEHRIDNASLGEVLEHLANLEERFYAYVHSHQERLNQRHKDSVTQEEEFAEEASIVKAKIQFLLKKSDQEKTEPGSSEDSSIENT